MTDDEYNKLGEIMSALEIRIPRAEGEQKAKMETDLKEIRLLLLPEMVRRYGKMVAGGTK